MHLPGPFWIPSAKGKPRQGEERLRGLTGFPGGPGTPRCPLGPASPWNQIAKRLVLKGRLSSLSLPACSFHPPPTTPPPQALWGGAESLTEAPLAPCTPGGP